MWSRIRSKRSERLHEPYPCDGQNCSKTKKKFEPTPLVHLEETDVQEALRQAPLSRVPGDGPEAEGQGTPTHFLAAQKSPSQRRHILLNVEEDAREEGATYR